MTRSHPLLHINNIPCRLERWNKSISNTHWHFGGEDYVLNFVNSNKIPKPIELSIFSETKLMQLQFGKTNSPALLNPE